MKRHLTLPLALLLALCTTPLIAQNLKDKLDGSKSWRSPSSSTQHRSNSYREQGGFTSQKDVIGKRELFQERRFSESDFAEWIDLVNYVDAVETFLALQKEGYVAQDGEVLKPLPIKGLKVKPGRIVKIRQIRSAREGHYTAGDLINELQRTKVLDDANFVPFPKGALKTNYADVDFSFLDSRFLQINLPVSQEQSARALKRDLNQLIRTKHRLNEVTQLESTTYQSRNETFLGQLGEQILGKFATDIFFPSRQKVNTFEADYDSNIAVSNFYSLRTRINSAPYSRGGDAWVLLNGRESVYALTAQQLRDNSEGDLTAGLVDIHRDVVVKEGNLNSGSVGLLQYGLTMDTLDLTPTDDSDALPAYYSPYIGISSVGRWTRLDLNVGLSYRTGANLDNALGWRYGFGFHIYPISPLSINFEYVSQNQPNFIDERTEWQLDRTSLGLTLHFKQLALSGGYRWYFTSQDELMSGWYVGGRYYL